MQIAVMGSGTPLVFVPGLQGRWEYMRRAVEALAGHFRVITFSLADEPDTGFAFDPDTPIESYAEQTIAAMDEAGAERAAICGVSYGGIVALRVAARHAPRVSQLILVSTPGPGWTLDRQLAFYVRHPAVTAPLFFAGVPRRVRAELVSAMPRPMDRARLGWEAACTLLHAPVSPSRMGARAQSIDAAAIAQDAAAITSPTLVVVGEESLDRIVPVAGSREYARNIRGAQLARLERTGHQGCITRPQEFARIVHTFVHGQHHAAA